MHLCEYSPHGVQSKLIRNYELLNVIAAQRFRFPDQQIFSIKVGRIISDWCIRPGQTVHISVSGVSSVPEKFQGFVICHAVRFL